MCLGGLWRLGGTRNGVLCGFGEGGGGVHSNQPSGGEGDGGVD